jgi:hypothetical protein
VAFGGFVVAFGGFVVAFGGFFVAVFCTFHKVSKFPICAALSSDPQRSASFRALLSSDPQRSASFRAALR